MGKGVPCKCEAQIVDKCGLIPLKEWVGRDIGLLYLEERPEFRVGLNLLNSFVLPAFLQFGDEANEVVVVLG